MDIDSKYCKLNSLSSFKNKIIAKNPYKQKKKIKL